MNQRSLAPAFLYTFCIGYAASILIDGSGNLLPYLSMVMILLGLALGANSASGKSTHNLILITVLVFPLAALNALISTNQADSALKWGLWIITLVGMSLMAYRSGPRVDEQLIRHTAPAFLIIWAALALKGNVISESAKTTAVTLHLSAFYANLVIATALFYPYKFRRILMILLGVFGALTSGSRAAFVFLPLVFLPGIIFNYRLKISTFMLIIMGVGAMVLIFQNETLNALTFGKKGAEITSMDSLELAQKSAGGRAELRDMGLNYISERPWGYGYGQSIDVIIDGKSMGNNLHNGYLNVATQMGLHIFFIYSAFIAWILYKLTTDKKVSRVSRFFTLSVIFCVLLRAVSESFSFFDLGHPASFLSIYLMALFVIRLRQPSIPRY